MKFEPIFLFLKSDLLYPKLTKIGSNVITKPTIQTVAKIANGLGIKIDDLMKIWKQNLKIEHQETER